MNAIPLIISIIPLSKIFVIFVFHKTFKGIMWRMKLLQNSSSTMTLWQWLIIIQVQGNNKI